MNDKLEKKCVIILAMELFGKTNIDKILFSYSSRLNHFIAFMYEEIIKRIIIKIKIIFFSNLFININKNIIWNFFTIILL